MVPDPTEPSEALAKCEVDANEVAADKPVTSEPSNATATDNCTDGATNPPSDESLNKDSSGAENRGTSSNANEAKIDGAVQDVEKIVEQDTLKSEERSDSKIMPGSPVFSTYTANGRSDSFVLYARRRGHSEDDRNHHRELASDPIQVGRDVRLCRRPKHQKITLRGYSNGSPAFKGHQVLIRWSRYMFYRNTLDYRDLFLE